MDKTDSFALTNFLDSVGDSIFLVNTLCICQGVFEKNPVYENKLMPITWRSSVPIDDSRRARSFALKTSLVYCIDSYDQYIRSVYGFTHAIHSKYDKLSSSNNGIAKRSKAMFDLFSDKNTPAYWSYCVELMISWRNFSVHSNQENFISHQHQASLREFSAEIKQNHCGIDIEQTISHYLSKQAPTQKDIATLISILIRAVRYFDSKLPQVEMDLSNLLQFLHNHCTDEDLTPMIRAYSSSKEKRFSRWKSFLRTNKIPATNEVIIRLSEASNDVIKHYLLPERTEG